MGEGCDILNLIISSWDAGTDYFEFDGLDPVVLGVLTFFIIHSDLLWFMALISSYKLISIALVGPFEVAILLVGLEVGLYRGTGQMVYVFYAWYCGWQLASLTHSAS